MGELLIATSGYSYKDWVGTVYPAGCTAKDFLSIYSTIFSFTELNFSYYRQPDPHTLERMLHMTDYEFKFTIKAHKSLTHEGARDVAVPMKQFKEGIAPLLRSGRLLSVVLQFPFSFHYTADNRRHLDSLCRGFGSIPLSVEFRNDQWQRDSVYEGLLRRNVAYINVDEPLLPGLPKPTAIGVSSHSYIRFHGRNAQQWWDGDNASRYDYSYNEQELGEWLPRIKKMRESSRTVMVLFNNHWKGQAVNNAKQLKKMTAEL